MKLIITKKKNGRHYLKYAPLMEGYPTDNPFYVEKNMETMLKYPGVSKQSDMADIILDERDPENAEAIQKVKDGYIPILDQEATLETTEQEYFLEPEFQALYEKNQEEQERLVEIKQELESIKNKHDKASHEKRKQLSSEKSKMLYYTEDDFNLMRKKKPLNRNRNLIVGWEEGPRVIKRREKEEKIAVRQAAKEALREVDPETIEDPILKNILKALQ